MTDLNFTRVAGNEYQAVFTSPGDVLVQVVRPKGNPVVNVYANLPGMPPCLIGAHRNPFGKSVLFKVEYPRGVEIRLKVSSELPITEACMMECGTSAPIIGGGDNTGGEEDYAGYQQLLDIDGDALTDMYGDAIYILN